MSEQATVLLIGNPNSGKTTLFNKLTGLSAKTGNYPGITVEHREGKATLPSGKTITVIDVPGTYSLVPQSDDEAVAVRALLGDLTGLPRISLVVCAVDATQLQRNLYLTAQLRELPHNTIIALTMTDVVAKDGATVDVKALEERTGLKVAVSHDLKALLDRELTAPTARLPHNPPRLSLDDGASKVNDAALPIGEALAKRLSLPGAARALALLAVQRSLSHSDTTMPALDAAMAETALLSLPARDRHELSARVIATRQHTAAELAKDIVVKKGSEASETTSQAFTRMIDSVVLHRVLGPIVMFGVFALLFQTLFSWSEPLITAIEDGHAALTDAVATILPESLPLFSSLIKDGVLAGVGNVVVFVPQIALLFLFIAVLEDTGYLARAAFLLDRVMAKVGLHGRAFVPMLSGFACAVPAILATRTIERDKDRLVTILVLPLMSCSARLPIYTLMIATVFAGDDKIMGVVEPGAAVMISMYSLSIVTALLFAALFKRTLLRSPVPPLVLELPAYRLPSMMQLYKAVSSRVFTFLKDAGTIILAITIVLWALLTFPRDHEVESARDKAIAGATATIAEGFERDAEIKAIEGQAKQALVEGSVAGRVGRLIEPALEPLGFDWKIGIGIIASFAAREVFVSTLGVVYGLGDAEDETSTSLRDRMKRDTKKDGTPLYTPLSAVSLLVFFLFAMQCMSTVAAVKRETRSWRWPIFQIAYMTVLAIAASLIVYQGGQALGLS